MSIFTQEWFWAMMQFFAVTISLIGIYWQIRLQRSTHVITAMDIFSTKWDSEIFLKARQAYCKQYNPERDEEDALADLICPFFEELGVYVRHRALPLDVVYEYFSYSITRYWKMSEGAIQRIRRTEHIGFYTEFEYLHQEIQRLAKKRGHFMIVEEQAIAKFREFELQRIAILSGLSDSLKID